MNKIFFVSRNFCYNGLNSLRAVFNLADLVRFGVSISKELLEKFDALVVQKGYNNRSEAIRDLIRNQLV